ncbi:MAG TPA: hypothetical protein VFJ90_12085, partial [Candidatus Didemnitutus sp.]|nr:hypothetical protein [Candidatus Didemnitutus sp.]
NRMRLTRLPAARAMEAVLRPGGGLVTEEVAKQIVYFVAGRGETENVEVEPSLLNLVCRELNNHRRTRKEETISTDLLAGSRDTILKEFYERALEDQPPAVRSFIENELLTESGYRENIALERARKALTNAGANPRALDVLVNRRLLRVEERLDIRRVELTHDVLCSVVKASRDTRLEREAKDEAQKQLALQKEREAATRRALMRARMIASICAVLAVGALGGAIFGFINMRRAWAAERKAQETRRVAERGRTEAEKLIVYLLDDFYLELEPIGRLDIVAELAKRALDYYHEIPAELQTPETERNRALALVRYGAILRNQDKIAESEKALTEAVETLTRLQKAGDKSELATLGLALGLSNESRVYYSLNKADDAKRLTEQARTVIEPVVTAATPSLAARRAYGAILQYQGFLQLRSNEEDAAIRTLQRAQEIFRNIDGLKLTDMPAAAAYTETAAWLVEALIRAGRVDEAQKVGQETASVAGRLLEKRPGHTSALRSRAIISGNMAAASVENLRVREALALSESAYRDWDMMARIDPSNTIAKNNQAAASMRSALLLARLGRVRDAADRVRVTLDQDLQSKSVMTALNLSLPAAIGAVLMADLGDLRQAEATIAETREMVEFGTHDMPADSLDRAAIREGISFIDYALPAAKGDYRTVHKLALAGLARVEQLKPRNEGDKRTLNEFLVSMYSAMANASYDLKDYATAEKEVQQAISYRKLLPNRTAQAERDASDDRILLGMTLAQEGNFGNAWKIIEPDLKIHRDLKARGSDDVQQLLQLATVLYAAALAQSAAQAEQAVTYLDEAKG